MTYDDAIKYLETLNTFGIKPGLERITQLLDRLDSPQRNYKAIHVAGTNGKGSVCSMLSEMLSTAGIAVGLFTSPHLISYRERFRLNGRDISESEFASSVDRIRSTIDDMISDELESPTQFEALTAMAFDYFSRVGVEYAVIEAGLGGLLDSTNVLEPIVSVITNVGRDHLERCGGTLEGVARHKAGIIKRGVSVVTAARGEPLRIVEETAARLDAPLTVIDSDYSTEGWRPSIFLETLALEGDYQRENAAVAVAAVQLLNDPRITTSTIERALSTVRWAGRFERFELDGREIVIDGAHNPDGAVALRRSLDVRYPDRPRRFLFGVLGDKDFESIIDVLFRASDEVIVTRPDSPRAAAPSMTAERLRRRSIRAEPVEDINAAFDAWLDGGADELYIAAGSLYMIGAVRALIIDRGKR